MRAMIGTELVRRLPLADVDIRDTKLRGFVLRCRTSGSHSYRVEVGRGRSITIGALDKLTPGEAREQARGILADVVRGRDPVAEKRAAKAAVTFKAFLEAHYEPWALQHQKRGAETVQRLRAVFPDLQSIKLSEITPWAVEKWRTARMKAGTKPPKPTTVNSNITMLKAALAKAVAWKLLPAHPLADVRPIQADRMGRIRYLAGAEEQRLRAALIARDDARRERRAKANDWRRERGYELWPADNADHLTPIVLLALNTGLRKGEIFGLRWSDVDLVRSQLTVRGEGAKSGQTRYVPLNTEAAKVLSDWQTVGAASDFVFAGRGDGEPLDDVKKAWLPVVRAAKLEAFTFHDLRHSFASKLVMAGVDLNTVRELLGHSDIKMTLRYAHLAPEHKAAAVAKLVVR